MNQSSASAHESIPSGPVNIALIEDAARDLENASEEIIAPGHWPSWSDPDIPDGLALCVGCWRLITAQQLGRERCPQTKRRPDDRRRLRSHRGRWIGLGARLRHVGLC